MPQKSVPQALLNLRLLKMGLGQVIFNRRMVASSHILSLERPTRSFPHPFESATREFFVWHQNIISVPILSSSIWFLVHSDFLSSMSKRLLVKYGVSNCGRLVFVCDVFVALVSRSSRVLGTYPFNS